MPESTPGRVIGRYALFDALATGGMATVHFGRLLGPVGFARTVAIKRLHPQYASDPEFVAMFLDEARMCARIRHPNVVPTLDIVTTNGELFLVMEYVQGESLGHLMKIAHKKGERIPWRIALGIVAGMLHGLHAAHEAKDERGEPLGLVHRDVSPQNVLVGVDGLARVVDFGIAKAGSNIHVTRENAVKGKLGYMAPEQMNQENLTRQADVYAAAVVLWEALTGKRLFDGESEAIVLSRVLGATIAAPSTIAKDVPPELDAIVLKGLSRDVATRHRSAKELANALDKIGPASPGEIGEWVEATAKAILDKRAQRIAEVEAGSSDLEPSEANTDPPPKPGADPVTGSDVRSDGRSSHPFGSARTLGSSPDTSARLAAAKAKSRKATQLITAAVVGAAALTTVAAWALTRSSSHASNTQSALAAAPPEPPAAASASATSSAVVAATETPAASSPPTAASAASSTPASASASTRTWSSGGSRPTATSKKSPFDLGGRN